MIQPAISRKQLKRMLRKPFDQRCRQCAYTLDYKITNNERYFVCPDSYCGYMVSIARWKVELLNCEFGSKNSQLKTDEEQQKILEITDYKIKNEYYAVGNNKKYNPSTNMILCNNITKKATEDERTTFLQSIQRFFTKKS